jgi:hypothetical protein
LPVSITPPSQILSLKNLLRIFESLAEGMPVEVTDKFARRQVVERERARANGRDRGHNG